MIFIACNRKLHLFDYFSSFETQNTEYNYIYVEDCIYKKLKKAVEICKNQTKNSALVKIYKVYIIYNPKCNAFGNSFFPLPGADSEILKRERMRGWGGRSVSATMIGRRRKF